MKRFGDELLLKFWATHYEMMWWQLVWITKEQRYTKGKHSKNYCTRGAWKNSGIYISRGGGSKWSKVLEIFFEKMKNIFQMFFMFLFFTFQKIRKSGDEKTYVMNLTRLHLQGKVARRAIVFNNLAQIM